MTYKFNYRYLFRVDFEAVTELSCPFWELLKDYILVEYGAILKYATMFWAKHVSLMHQNYMQKCKIWLNMVRS